MVLQEVHCFPFLSWNLVFKHTCIFSSEESASYLPFQFGELLARIFISIFAYIIVYVSTDDMKLVFGSVSDKGRYVIIEIDYILFITGVGTTIAKYDCCAEVAINVTRINSWLGSLYGILSYKNC